MGDLGNWPAEVSGKYLLTLGEAESQSETSERFEVIEARSRKCRGMSSRCVGKAPYRVSLVFFPWDVYWDVVGLPRQSDICSASLDCRGMHEESG